MPPDSLVGPGVFCIYPLKVSEKLKKRNAIGFPPPLLGERPLRLNVLEETDDWMALDKLAAVGTRAHPWDNRPDLDSALNTQLEVGKPELLRMGASLFGSVYYLDPEISGVALFAKNRDALGRLRNCFGSGECKFTFFFLAASGSAEASARAPDSTSGRRFDSFKTPNPSRGDAPMAPLAEFQADAPLLPHRVKPKMIPSTAKGKKSFTQFIRVADSDLGWTLWEAQVDFFRPHQVRAHAATHGIPVLGDEVYGGPASPTVRQIQPRAQRSRLDAAVFGGLAIHLSRVDLSPGVGAPSVESSLPKPFALLLKRLGVDLSWSFK